MRAGLHQRFLLVSRALPLIFFCFCAVCRSGFAQHAPDISFPSDTEIKQILADRIDNQKQSLGIVVGILEPAGRRVITYGTAGGRNQSLDGDTIFEIGGITKVFTALLLADMVQSGQAALTDPVAKYLPKEVRLPEDSGKITLQDLATHTSGLPRNPTDLAPANPQNPFADYTAQRLYHFVSGYALPSDSVGHWEYSNVGFGLLGQALASRAHMSYEAIVHSRIAAPLGMNNTGITFSPEQNARRAVGHNWQLSPVPDWSFQALAGAGALRSTANDLLKLVAAELGYTNSPLAPAMAAMLKVRRPTNTEGLENALGWQVRKEMESEIVEKDGATISGGYSTFIAYVPKTRIGVVVLSNAFTPNGVSDIGLHLLNPLYPLRGKQQREVTLDPKLFDRYVGDYMLSATTTLSITRQGNTLFAQTTGQPKWQVFAQSERTFFYKVYDAQLAFETDTAGPAKAVVLYYNGIGSRAKRIDKPVTPTK